MKQVAAELKGLGYPIDLAQVRIETCEAGRAIEKDPKGIPNADGWAVFAKLLTGFRRLERPSDFAAYYVPWRKAVVFRLTSNGRLDFGDPLVAHELAHAYQHQTRKLWAADAAPTSTERRWVEALLTEGEAELVALRFRLARAGRSLDDVDLATLDRSYRAGVAYGVSGQAVYPVGARFVAARFRAGGRAAVDLLYRRADFSTEQILHPAKLGKDLPTAVGLPEWPGAKVLLDETLGEHVIRDYVGPVAATGWDGDRVRVLRLENGDTIAIWRTIWDREEDARQFRQALAQRAFGMVQRRVREVTWFATSNVDHVGAWTAYRRKLGALPPENRADAESTAAVEGELESHAWPERKAGSLWPVADLGIAVPVPPAWWIDNTQGVYRLTYQRGPTVAYISLDVTPYVDGSLDALEKRIPALQQEGVHEKVHKHERVDVMGKPALLVDHGWFANTLLRLYIPRGKELLIATAYAPQAQIKQARAALLGIRAWP
ncbi:MAG: hypothetical protein ACYTGN_14690 [Planctomycetota bacterium]